MSPPINAKEWVVHRTHHNWSRVTIKLPASSGHASGIAKLRRLLPILQEQSPSDLLNQIRTNGLIDLGVIPGREAWRLSNLLRANNFEVTVEDASYTTLFPVNQTDSSGLIIEDNDEAEAFCLQLIANGASVIHSEA